MKLSGPIDDASSTDSIEINMNPETTVLLFTPYTKNQVVRAQNSTLTEQARLAFLAEAQEEDPGFETFIDSAMAYADRFGLDAGMIADDAMIFVGEEDVLKAAHRAMIRDLYTAELMPYKEFELMYYKALSEEEFDGGEFDPVGSNALN